MRGWSLLVLLVASPVFAGSQSYPSIAMHEDPSTCSVEHATICDDAPTNAALDEFPYWNNMMWRDNGSTTAYVHLQL